MAPRQQGPHYQYWNVCGAKKSQRTVREPPPSNILRSRFERWCSTLLPTFQPSDYTQRTTEIERLCQASTHSKEGKRASKLLTLSSSSETSACRSHSFSFIFLSPHPSPFCQRPCTVRERLSLAVTVGSPGSGDPAARPHALPNTSYPGQHGSSKPPSQVPSLRRKRTPFRHSIQPDNMQSKAVHTVLGRFGRRNAFTFGPRFAVAVPLQAFLGNPISPHVSYIKRLITA